MPDVTEKHRKRWSPEEEQKLAQLAKWNFPTELIVQKLGRSASSIYSKASELKISLKTTAQKPYKTKR